MGQGVQANTYCTLTNQGYTIIAQNLAFSAQTYNHVLVQISLRIFSSIAIVISYCFTSDLCIEWENLLTTTSKHT